MGKSTKRKQYQNRRKEVKRYQPPEPKVPQRTEEEEMAEVVAKYGEGNMLKNILRIWRDTSKLTFLSYLPVIALEALYAVTWFLVSMLILIPPARNFCAVGRDIITLTNVVISAFIMPLVLTVLHGIYAVREKKKYFSNALRYVFPASLLYLVLDIVNNFVAVMFYPDRSVLIAEKLNLALWQGGFMAVIIALAGFVVQMILTYKFSQDRPIVDDLRTGRNRFVKRRR